MVPLFQDADGNGVLPHLHGSPDPAGSFQRQIEAHGFQVVACEASYGEYDFGNDANSLVAELRAMGGPFSGSFIRYARTVLVYSRKLEMREMRSLGQGHRSYYALFILVSQRRGEGRLLAGLRRRVRGRQVELRGRRKVHSFGGIGQEACCRCRGFISDSDARGEKVNEITRPV